MAREYLDDEVLRQRVRNTLKQTPKLYTRWVFLRDRMYDDPKKIIDFRFWKFVTDDFGTAYKALYGVLALADYERVQEILRTLADLAREAEMEVRPFEQKPDEALIRDDVVVFRWTVDSYVAAVFRQKDGGRELFGIELPTQEDAFKEAIRMSNRTGKAIVYITRRGQRRTLTEKKK